MRKSLSFTGYVMKDGCWVTVNQEPFCDFDEACREYYEHWGWAWGRDVAGSYGLAWCLLHASLQNDALVESFVRDFMTDVIFELDCLRGWTISAADIEDWVAARARHNMLRSRVNWNPRCPGCGDN